MLAASAISRKKRREKERLRSFALISPMFFEGQKGGGGREKRGGQPSNHYLPHHNDVDTRGEAKGKKEKKEREKKLAIPVSRYGCRHDGKRGEREGRKGLSAR